MTLGRDTTDESIIWNPGEPYARTVTGLTVDAPKAKAPEDAAVEEEENDEDEGDEEKVATADKEAPDGDTPPEENVETSLPPEGEAPSPPEDLKENTNVETDALKEAIDEAGPVPEASDVEINGDPVPVSEPNPEPGTVTQP